MPNQNVQPWGTYTGLPVEAQFDADGRTMHILKALEYTAPDGHEWVAPKGWQVDGASIPKAFWSIIGGPFEGKYREASVLHDVACDQRSRPWKDVARMFYTAMRCSGVDVVKAKTMFYAVFYFGPHWKIPAPNQPFALSEEKQLDATELMPKQPDERTAQEVHAWIEREDPSIEEIEASAQPM